MLLTALFLIIVGVVLGTVTWLKTRGTKLSNGIRVETRDNLKDFFHAVLEDNDN